MDTPSRRGKKPGSPKTGGRKKGTPNRTTTAVKEALEHAFKGIGGKAAFTRWAKENPEEFYKLWVKLLPREIDARIDASVNATGKVVVYLPDNGRDGATESDAK